MHASRAQPGQREAIGASSTPHLFGISSNNVDMKYVQVVSSDDQASTSYAGSPRVVTTTFPPTQDTYPNTQVVTGTAADGSVVEYLIDNRDFNVNGLGQTVYVEVVPNVLSNEINNDDDEPQLNEEEVLAIERGFLDYTSAVTSTPTTTMTTTPAKKSRYSRMTAAERDRYNARRRQRRLEKKAIKDEEVPSTIFAQYAQPPSSAPITMSAPINNVSLIESRLNIKTESEELIFADDCAPEDIKVEVVDDVQEKYESQPPQQQNPPMFQKQREDEEESHIFSSDSSDQQNVNMFGDDSLAQMLTARNARRAEKARQRYQRMTVEQRRNYNHRRTVAKKARKLAAAANANRASSSVNSVSESAILSQHLMQASVPQSAELSDEILSLLEQEAMRQQPLDATQLQKHPVEHQYNSLDDTIEQVAAFGSAFQIPNNNLQEVQVPKVEPAENVVQEYAEPVSLPLVFIDQHGNPAQLPEGSVIEVRQEHPNGPQTIIIHTAAQLQPQLVSLPPASLPEPPQPIYVPPPTLQDNVVQLFTQGSAPSVPPSESSFMPDVVHIIDSESSEPSQALDSALVCDEDIRAKRAARARERYHRMTSDHRREFNARRAIALRRARVRDEELCRIGEESKYTGTILDEATTKAVNEAIRRRARRAENARLKYQRMTMEERRIFNANRDAVRKARKRDNDHCEPDKTVTLDSLEFSVKDEPLDFTFS